MNQKKPNKSERDNMLLGATYKVQFTASTGEITLYITINNLNGRPYELFLNCKKPELVEHASVVMVLISHMLRDGAEIATIAGYLNSVHSPFTGHLKQGGYSNSVYDRIGETLLDHVKNFSG